jgi:hypothetical protein
MAIKRGWILMEQADAKRLWNPTKRRHETWIKTAGGAWVLVKGEPIDINWDNFVSPSYTTSPALYGIRSQIQWWATGRPAPTGANFAQLNELGGGLELKTRATANRWVAIHTGDIYPFSLGISPHLYLRSATTSITNVHLHAGLVGSVNRPSTGGVHSQPDDGIYILFDTSVDSAYLYSVTRSGGVETAKKLAAVDTEHHNFCMRVSDAGDEVEFLMDGALLTTHASGENLPTGVQLQPYYEVMTFENSVKSVHLHYYIQLFDALWL